MTRSGTTRIGVAMVLGAHALMSIAAESSTSTFSSHFNQLALSGFNEPYRGFYRSGDNFEDVLLGHIQAARISVDLAVMGITLPNVAQALAAAARRGVRVRVVMDNSYRLDWSALTPDEVASLSAADQEIWAEVDTLVDSDADGEASETERIARDVNVILAQAGIPVIDDTEDGSKGSGLMHHKFVAIDGQVVLTGSANWTHSGFFGDIGEPTSRGNAENLVAVRHADVARAYGDEFALMWGDGPGGVRNSRFGIAKGARPVHSVYTPDGLVQVQFGPFSSTNALPDTTVGLIDRVLRTATSRVDLGAFVMTEASLTDTLGQLASNGVVVTGIFDAAYAYNEHSSTLDMWGVRLLDATCNLLPASRPWGTSPMRVGVPRLPAGDKLHHKIAIVDERAVITGSMNWSMQGLRGNDENVLVLHAPQVAQDFRQELDRLHQGAVAYGPTPALRARAAREAQRCINAATTQ